MAIPGSGLGTKAVTLTHRGRVTMCPALQEMLAVPLFWDRDFRPARCGSNLPRKLVNYRPLSTMEDEVIIHRN